MFRVLGTAFCSEVICEYTLHCLKPIIHVKGVREEGSKGNKKGAEVVKMEKK